MQISDIRAYSDSALMFTGEKQVEQSCGKVARNTLSNRPEKVVMGDDADFLSDDIYKGNFIDIYA